MKKKIIGIGVDIINTLWIKEIFLKNYKDWFLRRVLS